MGNSTSKFRPTITVIGMQGSGKSSILRDVTQTRFLSGDLNILDSNVVIKGKKKKAKVVELPGRPGYRSFWDLMLPTADAIVFVLDSSDGFRLSEAREELKRVVKMTSFDKQPIAVIANKQDLPEARKTDYLARYLNLENLLKNRDWFIQAGSIEDQKFYQQAVKQIEKLFKCDLKKRSEIYASF